MLDQVQELAFTMLVTVESAFEHTDWSHCFHTAQYLYTVVWFLLLFLKDGCTELFKARRTFMTPSWGVA